MIPSLALRFHLHGLLIRPGSSSRIFSTRGTSRGRSYCLSCCALQYIGMGSMGWAPVKSGCFLFVPFADAEGVADNTDTVHDL